MGVITRENIRQNIEIIRDDEDVQVARIKGTFLNDKKRTFHVQWQSNRLHGLGSDMWNSVLISYWTLNSDENQLECDVQPSHDLHQCGKLEENHIFIRVCDVVRVLMDRHCPEKGT